MMRKMATVFLFFVLSFLLWGCQVDASKLKIELNESVDTVQLNAEYTDPGATGYYGDTVISCEAIENNVDVSKLGTYTITYEANYFGTKMTKYRVVTVVDETPPAGVLLPGVDTVLKGGTWIDAGVSATDNDLQEVLIEVQGTVNTSFPGEVIITYILSDQSGNQTIIERHVFVIDLE